MENVITCRNCVYQSAYHMVWCPNYRLDILTGEVAVFLDSLLDEISSGRRWVVLAKEVKPDDIHWFLSFPPSSSIADVIKILKGVTGRRLFICFPELKKRMWGGHLWSPSYYVGTAGKVSADTIRNYIERTEHVTRRR